MRRIWLVLVFSLLLSGCATYKFQKGAAPYDKGYVASYDGKVLPEYTLGRDNSVPEMDLAKERFKRRRAKVEYYYKKMGQIEARFKELFWDPPAMCVDFIFGIFRWPFVAVADYKYNRNPEYKQKVDRLDEQNEELEKAKVKALKTKLKAYIDEDLAKESGEKQAPVVESVVAAPVVAVPAAVAPVVVEQAVVVPATPAVPVETAPQPVVEPVAPVAPVETVQPAAAVVAAPQEIKPIVPKEVEKALEPPHAVIIAKPAKGPSPLQVNFNAAKSYSKSGKIVSYLWDFGDGDTSTKKNPLNTYWSTTYGSRTFTATLTVKDAKGQVASASTVIEVVTK